MTELGTGLPHWLPGWLPQQRWFAAKGTVIERIEVVHEEILAAGDPSLHLVIAAVDGVYYQFLLGHRDGGLDDHLAGHVVGEGYYDATVDSELASRLTGLFGSHPGFVLEPGVELAPGKARRLTAEQSNTSLVFGSQYILKLFRHPVPGENRDLLLHRALAAAGSTHIAAPLGSITVPVPEGPLVLGMLQRFLADAVDGWETATASVRDLMAEADLHAAEVGGDFAGEAERLGHAVATVHHDLAAAFGTATGDRGGVLDAMAQRLHDAVRTVPDLAAFADQAAKVFDAARDGAQTLAVQQVHGDLHLGQVLRTTAGWVLIDFEGEPAADPALRHEARSPLADIAGMLRSFDYAAHQPRAADPHADHQISVRAREWAVRNIDAFCTGYAAAVADPRDDAALLRAFELDKAIYEVRYEAGHRPGWLGIPLGAVRRLVGAG